MTLENINREIEARRNVTLPPLPQVKTPTNVIDIRTRQMIAELPESMREILKLKGMIK